MKAWLAFASLAAICLAPQAAGACSIAISEELLWGFDDPFERDISDAERERRMVDYRQWLAGLPEHQQREWANDALVWTGYEYLRQAQILVDALLPPAVGISGGGPCSTDGPYPAANDALYDEIATELVTAQPLPPPPIDQAAFVDGVPPIVVIASPVLDLRFPQEYAALVNQCSDETRDIVAAELLERAGEYVVSDVLGELLRRGYAQGTAFRGSRRSPLMAFGDAGQTRLVVAYERRPVLDITASGRRYAGLDEVNAEISDQAWSEVSEYLQEDPQLLAVVAAIEEVLAERRSEAAPYHGYCPQVAAGVRELALQQFDRRRLVVSDRVEQLLGS